MTTEEMIRLIADQMPEWARKRASAFNTIMRYELEKCGYTVRDEVMVAARGDGRRGRVDLVIDYPEKIAIEVDRRTARKKSTFKLTQLPDHRPLSVIRDPL